VALLLAAFGLAFSWLSWQAVKTEQIQHLSALTELGEKALDSYFSQYERALEFMGRDLLDQDGAFDAQRAQLLLKRFIDVHAELPDIALLRLDGQILVTAKSALGAALPSVAKEPSFVEARQELLQGRTLSIGRPLIGLVVKQWVIPFRYGVRDKRGNLLFIVAAGMPLSKPQSFWKNAPLPSGTAAGLRRDDDYLVSRYPIPDDAELENIYARPMTGVLGQYLRQERYPVSGFVEGTDSIAGPDRLFVFRRLSHHPLTFFVVTPLSNIRARWWSEVRSTYLLMLVLMAGGFSVYRWTLKRQIAWALETRRTGEQIRDALAEKNTILKTAPVGIAFLRDRRYICVNRAMSEISGFAEAELTGQETRILYASPEDFERVGKEAYALLARGERYETGFPIKRKNGDRRWVNVTGQAVDVSDPAKGSIWVMEDISARKRAETMLRDRERQLGLILDAVPAQVAYFDAEQRFRFVNLSFEKWNGVSRAEILGKTLRDVRGEEAYRQRRPYVEATLSGRVQTAEDYFDFPGVGRRYVLVSQIPDFAPDGTVKGFYTIVADLTERKEAHNHELETEKALRNTLVREVRHRVKNTLQGTTLLMDTFGRAHPELSEAIEPAVARLNAMAAVFGLQAAEDAQAVVLRKLVVEICGVLAKAMECSIEPVIESAIVGPVQIAENESVPVALIINELVFNAVKHGRPGEPIRVFLDSDGESVSVRVMSAGAVLPSGFDFESGVGVGTGLQLVKSMLTKESVRVEITSGPEGVSAKLVLRPPAIRPVHGAAD